MLLQKLKIDDPVDAAPVHGFCGMWGCIACGLFDWGKARNVFGWASQRPTPHSSTLGYHFGLPQKQGHDFAVG